MKLVAKPMMVVLAGLLVMPMLTACEYIKSGRQPVPPMEEAATFVPNTMPVPSNAELRAMTNRLSGGSVEIYNIDDDNAVVAGGVPGVTQVMDGIPYASDPRVTVYPLDASSPPPGVAYSGGPLTPEWPSGGMPGVYGGADPGKLPSRMAGGVSSVYFDYGSAQLSGPDRSVLNSVAETAKFAPVERVSVEGHASAAAQTSDPIKAKVLNLKESMNRAMAVSQDLIQRGVPAEKLKTVGWGDTKPSGMSEAEQRRVDIITGAGQ